MCTTSWLDLYLVRYINFAFRKLYFLFWCLWSVKYHISKNKCRIIPLTTITHPLLLIVIVCITCLIVNTVIFHPEIMLTPFIILLVTFHYNYMTLIVSLDLTHFFDLATMLVLEFNVWLLWWWWVCIDVACNGCCGGFTRFGEATVIVAAIVVMMVVGDGMGWRCL